jgi:hypothetical protein
MPTPQEPTSRITKGAEVVLYVKPGVPGRTGGRFPRLATVTEVDSKTFQVAELSSIKFNRATLSGPTSTYGRQYLVCAPDSDLAAELWAQEERRVLHSKALSAWANWADSSGDDLDLIDGAMEALTAYRDNLKGQDA